MLGACRECGLPRVLSLTQRWRDGCIVDVTSGSASLCVYEAAYPTILVEEIETKLGVPLQRIVYHAGTHAAVKVLGVLYETHPLVGKVLFSAPVHSFTENLLVGFGKAIGVADVEIIERRRGDGATVTIKDPFDLPNCLAIISGILQIADGCRITYEILKENGSYVVSFKQALEEAPDEEAYHRLFAENLSPARADGDTPMARCRKCGAPSGVGAILSFDLERGLITDRSDGARMIFMGVHGLNSILRELGRELDGYVDDLLISFERRKLAERLARMGLPSSPWAEARLREYLALRGLGLLERLRERNGSCEITVMNAFLAPVVAGRLLAFWEHHLGREGSIEYEVDRNTLRLALS
ncbi:MAG: hypothetical protein HPY75_00085 [Actinobacteria bacterium]|nr:hypothetical protein [Actinomycetota bacterium]